MRKSRLASERIPGFTRQAEAGTAASKPGRQHGFGPASFYAWRAQVGGMQAEDTRRLQA